MGAGVSYPIKKLDFEIAFNITPFVKYSGTDDHILRSLEVQIESEDGTYYQFDLNGEYSFMVDNLNFAISAYYQYSGFNITGLTDFVYYSGDSEGEEVNNIATDIEFSRKRFGINIGLNL